MMALYGWFLRIFYLSRSNCNFKGTYSAPCLEEHAWKDIYPNDSMVLFRGFGSFLSFLYLSVYCEFVLTPKNGWEDKLLTALSTSYSALW